MDASQLYPLRLNTIREIMDDPSKLKGKRSEVRTAFMVFNADMRYEPFRMAKNNELSSVAYRRLIAAIDWVEHLAALMGGLSVEDKIALVKNAFAPLMVFKFASRTAEVAKDENILCLCNFAYVPRNISQAFSDSYHLGNGLVDRALDELVRPYRAYGMREEEIVCVSAMIVLNPSFEKILEMRNKIEDTLYMIVKEARFSQQPAVCFGHILLSLPIVTFRCFPVEPFSEEENTKEMESLSLNKEKPPGTMCDKQTQTERVAFVSKVRMKRPYSMTNPVDDEPQRFKLLQPPGNYTLTEMFDDLRCIGVRSDF
ncbi:Ligand-binding domain of nuclear hormone receptor [Ancylostoma duodenale]|uniref:Ligand-binding domain of nuclear hormone receptor n=1 Tax=Ancylostoma duodenale TaxID=51022 RepID=A0A0C2CM47_9BILA|nr:Ligand-binding domain of nuclear hormone receptor [Ancylostoma duodenale]